MTEVKFELLPTGKPNVSFSEISTWKSCSFRHKLQHVKKIDLGKPSPILVFGTSAHSGCEQYLRHREGHHRVALEALDKAWEKPEHTQELGFTPKALTDAKVQMIEIMDEVPTFLETQFPDWEFVEAEHMLFEPIEGYPHAFKGFVDAIILAKGARNKDVLWILDWKTCMWGWDQSKKQDEMVRSQIVLYKNFISKKVSVPFSDIRCGFVLLKKTAKVGQKCELLNVSVGDVTLKRSLKILNNMVSSVRRGVALKNKGDACTYCDYKNTEHCT